MNMSVGIIAKNEENYLPLLLEDILNQNYNLEEVELILVDSLSTDSTYNIMEEFKEAHVKVFKNILLLSNPKVIQSSGWNIVINNYNGDSLTRLDAHSRIDDDFFAQIETALNIGEKVVGGPRPSVLIDNPTIIQQILYMSENLKIGSGINSSRRGTKNNKYVNSMFHATYTREVIKNTGLFNEKLLRTEDNEYHYRVREKGYNLFYTNKIRSYQYARPSVRGFFKQKFGNGYWVGRTILFNYKILEVYHIVPFLFVLFYILALLFKKNIMVKILLKLVSIIYLLPIIISAIIKSLKEKHLYYLLIIIFIPLTHIVYGLGTFFGLSSYLKGGVE